MEARDVGGGEMAKRTEEGEGGCKAFGKDAARDGSHAADDELATPSVAFARCLPRSGASSATGGNGTSFAQSASRAYSSAKGSITSMMTEKAQRRKCQAGTMDVRIK